MGRYLLGIDNGSTVCKAALFDLNGRELHAASRQIPTQQPQPGWMERDLTQVWRETAAAIREVVTQINAAAIVAIGCTGHGNGAYLLDEAGQPLRNSILSLDTRAASIVDDWQTLHPVVFPSIWQHFYAGQTAPLLAWLKQHEPANYARLGRVLLCKDYINYCLTGEQATDYTDVSTSALLRTPDKRYDRTLLDHYGIPEVYEALPRLAHSAEVIGTVTAQAAADTGLAPGTPVIAGMIDIDASAIGAGVVAPQQACIVAGSWSINEVITSQPSASPDLFLTAPFAAPDLWLTCEASATSAANLEWFVRLFGAEEQRAAEQRGVSVFDVCGELVDTVPVSADVPVFHPFLYGSNMQTEARAGFYGLAGWHTRAHLLRGLYEGIVFGHLSHVERLRAAGADFDIARLAGGGARSAVWSQMFADILDVTIEVPDSTETGTRGAALAAGVGAGVYADYVDATDQSVTVRQVYEPIHQRSAIYHARYAIYRELLDAMAVPWRRFVQQPSKEKAL
ncbi:MAG: carbohydrate kinase [Anaerolineae bacterium]|nr:carbohydrate kinase [Anaerolineae bacterium]